MKNEKSTLFLFVVWSLLAAAVMLPDTMLLPGTDSGAFLYTGQRILAGDIPYKDVWDHKPPAVLFINAAGLFIGNGSWLGVWTIEWVFIVLACVIGFMMMRREFGMFPAIAASLLWLASYNKTTDSGNYTEEYALFFQFASLYLMAVFDSNSRKRPALVLLGVMCGAAFMLRQNLIGVWIAWGLYRAVMAARNKTYAGFIADMLSFCLGFSCVAFATVFYFYLNDALPAFWSAAFGYNFLYSDTTLLLRLDSMIYGFRFLLWYQLGIAAWAGIVLFSAASRKAPVPLLAIALIDLPFEIGLTSVSGFSFNHYFTSWLPALSVIICYAIRTVRDGLKAILSASTRQLIGLIAAGILVSSFLEPGYYMVRRYKLGFETITGDRSDIYHKAAGFIGEHTESDDYVFIWGAEGTVYYLSRRQSPTRFFYQYPFFYKRGYMTEAMYRDFFREIEDHAPRLIIDTNNQHLPPLASPVRPKHIKRGAHGTVEETYTPDTPSMEGLGAFYAFFAERYDFITTLTDKEANEEWFVYRLRERPLSPGNE